MTIFHQRSHPTKSDSNISTKTKNGPHFEKMSAEDSGQSSAPSSSSPSCNNKRYTLVFLGTKYSRQKIKTSPPNTTENTTKYIKCGPITLATTISYSLIPSTRTVA